MNRDESSWRRSIGERVANHYAVDDRVAATAVAGSVGRGWADRRSDIELLVFWSQPPRAADRSAAVTRSGGAIDVDWADDDAPSSWDRSMVEREGSVSEMWPLEDGEYSEHFYLSGLSGVLIGVSGFHTETVERWVDTLVSDSRPHTDAQILAAALLSSFDVTGTSLLEGWRDRLREFPDDLRLALVAAELTVDESWWSVDSLAERNDRPALDLLLVSMARRIVRCLLALNRLYLPDPRPKWTRRLLSGLTHAPRDVARRLESAWGLPPVDAARRFQALFDETLDVIEAEAIGVDIARTRRLFRHRRPVIEAPPADAG